MLQIRSFIEHYLKITNTPHKGKESKYQQSFALCLTMLSDNLHDSGLDLTIEDVVNEYENYNNYINIKEESLDRHLKKILLNANIVEEQLNDYLCKKNLRSNVKNFLKNDSFGSLNQYRAELVINYNTEQITLDTKDKNKIDLYI